MSWWSNPTPSPPPPPPPPGDPKCCCCIISAVIQNIRQFNNGSQFGHYFDFVIRMNYNAGGGGICSCVLHWNEKTDVPVVSGAKINEWYDAYALSALSPTFDPWNNKVEPCPGGGPLNVTITDGPALGIWPGRTVTRTLKFNLVVNSCAGCQCANATKSDTATQILSISIGVPLPPSTFTHP